MKGIVAALATRFDAAVSDIRRSLKGSTVREWGKVRRVDTEEGDMIHVFTMVKMGEDNRDASYVRVRIRYFTLWPIIVI